MEWGRGIEEPHHSPGSQVRTELFLEEDGEWGYFTASCNSDCPRRVGIFASFCHLHNSAYVHRQVHKSLLNDY